MNLMKKKINIAFFFLSTFTWVIINPDLVLATQVHGAPEGVYAHQIHAPDQFPATEAGIHQDPRTSGLHITRIAAAARCQNGESHVRHSPTGSCLCPAGVPESALTPASGVKISHFLQIRPENL